MNDPDRLSKLATEAALLVEDGMRVGLGSGSAAEAFVVALGERIAGGLRVKGVATSHRTEAKTAEAGIELTTLDDFPLLDLGIDGADEIDPDLNLVKGRGGALLYEKIVAHACMHWVIVAAAEKLVDSLGTRIRLPVEIMPFGWEQTARYVKEAGVDPLLRIDRQGEPFVTDGGHYILDCQTGGIDDAPALAAALKGITGVVDHGLFIDLADAAMTVDQEGIVTTHKRPMRGARFNGDP